MKDDKPEDLHNRAGVWFGCIKHAGVFGVLSNLFLT
jgi:hypothetical protein